MDPNAPSMQAMLDDLLVIPLLSDTNMNRAHVRRGLLGGWGSDYSTFFLHKYSKRQREKEKRAVARGP